MLKEMVRAVRKGGTVAAYVWDYAGQMQLLRSFWDAAVALDPAAHKLDEGQRFPLCQPEPLRQVFRPHSSGRWKSAQLMFHHLPPRFRRLLDSVSWRAGASSWLCQVACANNDYLRDHLRAILPIAADGSIPLSARAWAVRGVREN